MSDTTTSPTAAGITRRTVLKTAGAAFGLYFVGVLDGRPWVLEAAAGEVAAGFLDPLSVPKWVAPLLVPPVMPTTGRTTLRGGKNADLYDIAVRQISQQVLPAPLPPTTLWAYGPTSARKGKAALLFHAPSATIEAKWQRPVRVTWRNELVDADGRFLPHLLPIDPTLHWANPPGGTTDRDSRPVFAATPEPYRGPVPVVTHVHGAVGVGDESDGYPEAWYLPDAVDLPAGHAHDGTWYAFFRSKAEKAHGLAWPTGGATFHYPDDQRASTLWYHDHTLGMTRANVYAGPAGFYLLRGGPNGDDAVIDSRAKLPAVLPGPAPQEADGFPSSKQYREIPLAIQDRSFLSDGSLFYPDSREYFDGTVGPYVPEGDVSPIWNPEFFGNTIMVNGHTWPTHTVEQRRYRFRLLNGCNARFLILDLGLPGAEAWQIGTEGGFLAAPVNLTAEHGGRLLLGPAERADVILDLTHVPVGSHIIRNLGPDEPFGGGQPDADFDVANPASTGQVLQLVVVPATSPDPTTPAAFLVLPAIDPLPTTAVRRLALVEEMSTAPELADDPPPIAALLGTVDATGTWSTYMWSDPITENPAVGAAETWEIFNSTADAHPIHVHEVVFQVENREPVAIDEATHYIAPAGGARPPEPGENGWKDTVIAYPGEVTRIRMRFDRGGQFVWHCHIVEHEDNEMMRPYRIGPEQPGQPGLPPA
ncbi:multicopper oxidase family protein [Cellulomonas humilata]|uniref:FtsP/CotA-like multicopper oxidase with cupredoxin domain n=1 Tax=Cellulomonas humilata TaxID=144055 RepID=A0ABU0EE52_9CELL|nr:multicopper oxidase [Cellulomonas humilata]MDQ0373345.1 FtsP/CotA-like multicopper oxidase with cupredoxin domain [Cellulomonas humilata]